MVQGLILETSTSKAGIALVDSHRLVQRFFLEGGEHLSDQIFTIIQKMNLVPKQLSFIGMGIGPGLYTGIRVSVTIGKTISYALQIPLITFCSLQAFVPLFKKGSYLSMLDAKIGGVYLLEGYKNERKLTFEDPKLLSVDQALKKIEKTPVICSNEIPILQKKFPEIQAKWMDVDLDMNNLATICLEKWVNKDFTDQDKLEPLYLREA